VRRAVDVPEVSFSLPVHFQAGAGLVAGLVAGELLPLLPVAPDRGADETGDQVDAMGPEKRSRPVNR
jgi:hypothetical protein